MAALPRSDQEEILIDPNSTPLRLKKRLRQVGEFLLRFLVFEPLWILLMPHRRNLVKPEEPESFARFDRQRAIRRILNVVLWAVLLLVLGRYLANFADLLTTFIPLNSWANALNFMKWFGQGWAVPAVLAGLGFVAAIAVQTWVFMSHKLYIAYASWFELLVEPGKYIARALQSKVVGEVVADAPIAKKADFREIAVRVVNAIAWGILLSGVVAALMFLSAVTLSTEAWAGTLVGVFSAGSLAAVVGQVWVHYADKYADAISGVADPREAERKGDRARVRRYLFFVPQLVGDTPNLRRFMRVLSMLMWGVVLLVMGGVLQEANKAGWSPIGLDWLGDMGPLILAGVGFALAAIGQLVDVVLLYRTRGEVNNDSHIARFAPPLASFIHGLLFAPLMYAAWKKMSPVKKGAFLAAHAIVWGGVAALFGMALLGNVFGMEGAGAIFGLLGAAIAVGVQYQEYRQPLPPVVVGASVASPNEILDEKRIKNAGRDLYTKDWGHSAQENLAQENNQPPTMAARIFACCRPFEQLPAERADPSDSEGSGAGHGQYLDGHNHNSGQGSPRPGFVADAMD